MPLTQRQVAILNSVAQFANVARYHGVMPSRHLIAYEDAEVQDLVDGGLVEWATFTYGCGKNMEGLRITPEGERRAARDTVQEPVLDDAGRELAMEHLLILQDVYHFSRMPRYRRMMPDKKAKHYMECDFEDLVNRGFILKMKIKAGGERATKGYVISGKGERALMQAGLD